VRSNALPKTNSIAVDNPQLTGWIPIPQGSRQSPDEGQYREFILILDAHDDLPGVFAGRVGPNVCEVQVQGHQDSIISLARPCNCVIISSREILVGYRVRHESEARKISVAGKFSSILNFTP
jgi:hypothetical protein